LASDVYIGDNLVISVYGYTVSSMEAVSRQILYVMLLAAPEICTACELGAGEVELPPIERAIDANKLEVPGHPAMLHVVTTRELKSLASRC
jgi:hypothetical protein